MPNGLIKLWINIYLIALSMSVFAFLNATPIVKPSAHLWHSTAIDMAKHPGKSYKIPIARPSKNAWIPIANYII